MCWTKKYYEPVLVQTAIYLLSNSYIFPRGKLHIFKLVWSGFYAWSSYFLRLEIVILLYFKRKISWGNFKKKSKNGIFRVIYFCFKNFEQVGIHWPYNSFFFIFLISVLFLQCSNHQLQVTKIRIIKMTANELFWSNRLFQLVGQYPIQEWRQRTLANETARRLWQDEKHTSFFNRTTLTEQTTQHHIIRP